MIWFTSISFNWLFEWSFLVSACLQHKWKPGTSLGWTTPIAWSTSGSGQFVSTSYWSLTSWSFTQSWLEFHRILSFHNSPFLEQLHVGVSELEHDDSLDLSGVKLYWCVLIHLSGFSSNFRRKCTYLYIDIKISKFDLIFIIKLTVAWN